MDERISRGQREQIAWTEDAEAILEGIDRKRRQVSSAVSRLRHANGDVPGGEPELPTDRRAQLHSIEQRLRARGWQP